MSFTNPLRATLASGGVIRGAWIASPSVVTAEAVAAIGYDYVSVDLQHGAVDYTDAVPMFAAIQGQGSTPMARMPNNDFAAIGKVLDAGALGIVVPLVDGTIPHGVTGEFGASKVIIRPASTGTGVIAGGGVRAVIESSGISNILTKSLGSNNPHNLVKATIEGLSQLRTAAQILAVRGPREEEATA